MAFSDIMVDTTITFPRMIFGLLFSSVLAFYMPIVIRTHLLDLAIGNVLSDIQSKGYTTSQIDQLVTTDMQNSGFLMKYGSNVLFDAKKDVTFTKGSGGTGSFEQLVVKYNAPVLFLPSFLGIQPTFPVVGIATFQGEYTIGQSPLPDTLPSNLPATLPAT